MRGWLDARGPAAAHDHDDDTEEAAPLGPAPAPGRIAPTGGSALPEAVRRRMEAAFSTSFASVRVSEGGQAEELGAEAFAAGEHIQFAPGRLDFQSKSGLELLGHELAHVVQQRQGRAAMPPGKLAPINADPGLEAEADRAGKLAAEGGSISVGGEGGGSGGAVAPAPAGGPLQLKGRRGRRQLPKPGPSESPYENRIVGENPYALLENLDDAQLQRDEEERQRRRLEARRRNRERQLAQNQAERERLEREERERRAAEELRLQEARALRVAEAKEQARQQEERQHQEEEEKRRREEEARRKREEEARRKREEEARRKREEEEAQQKREEEELRRRQEEERKKREQEERLKREQEEAQKRQEEERLKREQEERLKREQEEAKKRQEEELRKKQEEERLKREEEERLRREEEEKRKEMVHVPAGSILTAPIDAPGTQLPLGHQLDNALYLPKGTKVSFIAALDATKVRQITSYIFTLHPQLHANELRRLLTGGLIASYLPLATPYELPLFANCMSMFQLSSCLTQTCASILAPHIQSTIGLQTYLQLGAALFVPHCSPQLLFNYLSEGNDPKTLLPHLRDAQLVQLIPYCAQVLVPRLAPLKIEMLLDHGFADAIVDFLTQDSCTGLSGVKLRPLCTVLRRQPNLLVWPTFEQLMMFDMQVLAVEIPCIRYLGAFAQMPDLCFSFISHLLSQEQFQQIRRRNGASKSNKANLQARCLACCKRLRLTAKVLDADDRDGLPLREEEIERGEKLAANLQELEILLEAAEHDGSVLFVQVGLHTLGKLGFLFEQRGRVDLKEKMLGLRVKGLEQVTHGGDGVVWRESGPTLIQAKGNSSNTPLTSQTWTTHEGAIKRGTVPFEDQLGEAANQLAGLVASGDNYGYENPLPGTTGGVVCVLLSGVDHPGDVSTYLAAAQRVLARQLNKKLGPAWRHVHELRITWRDGRTTSFLSNDDGTYRQG